jgi:hypothetical protein
MSRSKRVFLNVLRAAIMLGILELFSQLVFRFRITAEDPMELLRSAAYLPGGPGRAFAGARLGGIGPDRARMLRALQDVKEVIHPYVGFVTPPPRSTETLDLEALGFERGGPFVRARREDTLVVGVFGGSVAKMFVEYRGPEVTFAQLGDLPEFRGKRLVVATLAQDGYKQPQSLFALSYFLSLGGKLDALLLIDGFNEVVLGPVENVPQGVFPFFPRAWAQRVADLNLATPRGRALWSARWPSWPDAERRTHAPFSSRPCVTAGRSCLRGLLRTAGSLRSSPSAAWNSRAGRPLTSSSTSLPGPGGSRPTMHRCTVTSSRCGRRALSRCGRCARAMGSASTTSYSRTSMCPAASRCRPRSELW